MYSAPDQRTVLSCARLWRLAVGMEPRVGVGWAVPILLAGGRGAWALGTWVLGTVVGSRSRRQSRIHAMDEPEPE